MTKRILIIEDDLPMRSFEKSILEARGYEILESDNAKEGLDIALKEKPDLVLMDIRLPNKKTGIGAARILRNTDETRDIPIIFVTGYVKGKGSDEVTNIPNCGYIVKPFEVRVFIGEIERQIG